MKLHNLRKARSLISLDQEYRLRTLIAQAIPTGHRSARPSVLHATGWRSGSQFVRLVMSDPEVTYWSGLSPRLVRSAGDLASARGRILTPVYMDAGSTLDRLPTDSFCFFVVRDPRSVIVSMYFSRLKSHPHTEQISNSREQLQQMTKADGMRYIADDYRKIARLTQSWVSAANNNRATIYRFEDLTGSEQAGTWASLLHAADIRMPESSLARVLNRYSFESLSGRARGAERVEAKYRAGSQSSWRSHLSGPELDYVMALWGDLIDALGYQAE